MAAGGAVLAVLVLLALPLYFAPTIVAVVRRHRNTAPIVIVNVLLGWLVVGWVVALAWAFMADQEMPRRGRYSRYLDD